MQGIESNDLLMKRNQQQAVCVALFIAIFWLIPQESIAENKPADSAQDTGHSLLWDARGEYDNFIKGVANHRSVMSVGVLPLVYHRQLEHNIVTQLGVESANEIADAIKRHSSICVLRPGQMERELEMAGNGLTVVTDFESVLAFGQFAGVDAIIFGSFERIENGSGGLGNNSTIQVQLHMVDLRTAKDVSASLSLPSGDHRHRNAYAKLDLAQSRWRVGSWKDPMETMDPDVLLQASVEAAVVRASRRLEELGVIAGKTCICVGSVDISLLTLLQRRHGQLMERLRFEQEKWDANTGSQRGNKDRGVFHFDQVGGLSMQDFARNDSQQKNAVEVAVEQHQEYFLNNQLLAEYVKVRDELGEMVMAQVRRHCEKCRVIDYLEIGRAHV